MSDVADNRPEPMGAMIERHAKELQAAMKREERAHRAAASAAVDELRDDAASVVAETLEGVRRRVAGGSVPVHAEYGGLPVELKLQLERAAQACGPDEHAAVVVVPRPDRYGRTERKAWAVIDVSHLYRD